MILPVEKAHPKQNMGLIDRIVRLLIGASLIGAAYYYSTEKDLVARIWDIWGPYSMMVAFYPIVTGMLGWEPIYAIFRVRSCGDCGRNQCGTLPYQAEAMFNHAPKYTEAETERSLEACHDDPVEHPHHKVWRNDREPILYPDEKTWDSYMMRMKLKEGLGI